MNTIDTSSYSIHTEDAHRAIHNITELAGGKLPEWYPYQLQINLTNRCNLFYPGGPKDCVGCSFPVKNNISASVGSLIEKVTQFATYQGRSVLITGGGEPGMYADWYELLLKFSHLNLSLDINTNGLVSDVYLKLLRNSSDGGTLLQKIYATHKDASTISFSVHDESVYRAIEVMHKIRQDLNLNIKIRSTLLIHHDTVHYEIENFLQRSESSGCDFAHFKPFHTYDENNGVRRFVKNVAAFEAVRDACNKPVKGMNVGALRLDRLHPDYQRFEEEIILKRRRDQTSELALDPLFTIFLDTNLYPAFNCDTKAIGLGNTPETLLDHPFAKPAEYFLSAVHSIVTTKTGNHLVGDNFVEMNSFLQSNTNFSAFIHFLRSLREKFFSAKLSANQVRFVLHDQFLRSIG